MIERIILPSDAKSENGEQCNNMTSEKMTQNAT